MPNTYTELRKTTVGTAASSVTLDLTGISGYTDLVLVTSVLGQSGGGAEYTEQLQFNADTSSGLYSDTLLRGDGSSALSGRHSNQNQIYLSVLGSLSTTVPRVGVINIQNYANASVFKTVLSREAQANTGVEAAVGLWRNTNAITSIRYSLQAGNIAVGSTFSLYGIKAAVTSPAAKATGGTIYEDDTSFYHVFGASGAFVPSQALTCQYLVIAGGGGGGSNNTAGGGGGAGGYRSSMIGELSGANSSPESTLSFASGPSYTVTIGGGGGGGNSSPGTSGTASSIIGGAISITSAGGGGGGQGNGVAGGSGGGGNGQTAAGITGGSGTSLQGLAGGNGLQTSVNYSAGGGGGAGAIGSTAISQYGGNGGAGQTSYLVGMPIVRAGGGGGANTNDPAGPQSIAGGTGAAGGGNGGRGSNSFGQTGFAATANSGSGGGGGATHTGVAVYAGGAGGSGIVIIKYAK
jgi:hypothetical protein